MSDTPTGLPNAGETFDPDTLRVEIPPAMQRARRWLLWRYQRPSSPNGKPRKVPHYVTGQQRTGKLDVDRDRERLGTLDDALSTAAKRAEYGVGFALGADESGHHWQGIDLDGIDQRPELAALVDQLPGYIERSPSGHGVHAIGVGADFDGLGSNDTGIEAYCKGRYFTVTGNAIGGDLEDLGPFVAATLAHLHCAIPPNKKATARKSPTKSKAHPSKGANKNKTAPPKQGTAPPQVEQLTDAQLADLRSALFHLRADDYQLWITTGQRLHSLGDVGRGLWLAWSATCPDKFDPADAANRWETFTGERTGWRAVLKEAQQAGWRNPRATVEQPFSEWWENATTTATAPDPEGSQDTLPPEEQIVGPYVWSRGIFYLVREVTTGRGDDKVTHEKRIPLANFSAIVAEERQYDDGIESEPRTLLHAYRPRNGHIEQREVEITTPQFSGMAWVPNQLGHAYVVSAGSSVRDHLRAAIQSFSEGMVSRRIYTHTGWREIDGQLCYLHAGGAITAGGCREDLDVDLPDALANYHLPHPPAEEEARDAVRASLRQLRLVDDGVGAVQLCRIFGPALARWFRLDFGVFVYGRTGTLKSELAALAMAHYGAGFNARSLPENWESTENAMLLKAFSIKDALFEIDDYNPSGSTGDHQALSKKADRVFRGAANRAGRGRLTSDIRLRRSYYPRGLVSASGEDLPAGRSLRARLWVLELTPGKMDLDTLTSCQRDAREGVYAAAFAAYLRWLIQHADALATELPIRYEELRAQAGLDLRDHERIPANLAGMQLILEIVFQFIAEIGALSSDVANDWHRRCGAALVEQGIQQAGLQESSEDANRAMEMLRAAFTTGRAHVIDAGRVPASKPPATDAHLLGWRGKQHTHRDSLDDDREPRIEHRWEALGEPVGYWVEPDASKDRPAPELWLSPDAVYGALARIARDQGAGALRSQHRLAKALVERGYLTPGDGRNIGHRHGRRNLSPSRVWRMPIAALFPTEQGQPEPEVV